MKPFIILVFLSALPAADLTGNWLAATDNHDGTLRRTYLNLKQDGDRITGSIRTTQFFYTITEAKPGPDGIKLTGSMQDGDTTRHTTYEVRLAGDELEVSTRRNARSAPTTIAAHRVPAGEGAMPGRNPLPALHPVRDNRLARTPPMGWNSWNKFASRVNDEIVRSIADAMASNGMKAAGYRFINIDDTWEAGRDAQGNIQSNKKFPDMHALAVYVHSKGLKLGIYSSPGPNTCAGYEGSYAHEAQDARTWAAWGIDYLKYDWCGARNLYTDADMRAVYQIMGDALLSSGRPIVFSLCQYGRQDVWKWGPDVGGNLWRTTGDIKDAWDSMSKIGFNQAGLAPYARPGHWNDPDMLEIGNGGMSDTEYKTHMSLWSMLAAPLMAGNDLRSMSKSILDILTNPEVIAIDQDPMGRQARRLSQSGDQEIWLRDLANGRRAVAFFNRGPKEAQITLQWSEAGFTKPPAKARDVWEHRDLKLQGPEYTAAVPSHGVVLLRL